MFSPGTGCQLFIIVIKDFKLRPLHLSRENCLNIGDSDDKTIFKVNSFMPQVYLLVPGMFVLKFLVCVRKMTLDNGGLLEANEPLNISHILC